MKKFNLILASSIFPLLFFSQVFAFQNEPDGFRGIKWKTRIEVIGGMVEIGKDKSFGGIVEYKRNDDELIIGGADLEQISYGFWQEQFIAVLIRASGYTNWQHLKAAVFEKFGEGNKPNRFMEEYFWFGSLTTMSLRFNEIRKEATLYISSKELTDQAQAIQKQKAKEGARKGF